MPSGSGARRAARRASGIHAAWRDTVGADAAVAEFARERACHADQPVLRDRAVHAQSRSRERMHAAQGDDRTAAVGEHGRQAGLRAVKRAIERDPERPPPTSTSRPPAFTIPRPHDLTSILFLCRLPEKIMKRFIQ